MRPEKVENLFPPLATELMPNPLLRYFRSAQAAGSIGAALSTSAAQSTLAVVADHLSSVSNNETETKKKKKKRKKKGKAAHREEGEKEEVSEGQESTSERTE